MKHDLFTVLFSVCFTYNNLLLFDDAIKELEVFTSYWVMFRSWGDTVSRSIFPGWVSVD